MGQAVLVTASRQYVGYYDADRRLVVASRAGSAGAWDAQVLDTSIGWDSHNYVTMALDASGNLHVAGNMHATKLNYYVTSSPGMVKTLTRVKALVDPSLESAVTYPKFLKSSTGDLLFKFRHGGSGNGNEYIYRFVSPGRQWSLLTPRGLLDGQGKSNAYTSTPVLGPDGYLHMVWMWRDTPNVSTNHSLSYARTKDYVNWENAQGASLSLPLTEAAPAVVDRAPAGSGLVNGKVSLGFDSGKRVVIAYARFDSAGGNQLFAARPDASGNWQRSQITKWSGVFPINGRGSLRFPFSVGEVTPAADGALRVTYSCNGSRTIVVDEQSLNPIADNPEAPQVIGTPALPPRDENAQWKTNRSTVKSGNNLFVLQWRSLPVNGDKPRPVIPAGDPLLLLEYKAE